MPSPLYPPLHNIPVGPRRGVEDWISRREYTFGDGYIHHISEALSQRIMCMKPSDFSEMLDTFLPQAQPYLVSVLLQNSFALGSLDFHVERKENLYGYPYVLYVESKFDVEPLFYSNWGSVSQYVGILYAYYRIECGFSYLQSVDKLYRDLNWSPL